MDWKATLVILAHCSLGEVFKEKKYMPYMEGLARQLNEAQCGQVAQTDCYLNR